MALKRRVNVWPALITATVGGALVTVLWFVGVVFTAAANAGVGIL